MLANASMHFSPPKFPAGAVPDSVLVFAAVLPWQFFSSALSESASSLIGNANLVSKIYFPRLVIPCAAVVTSLVDFLITFGLMATLMLWYGAAPSWQIVTLPFFMLMAFGLALGPEVEFFGEFGDGAIEDFGEGIFGTLAGFEAGHHFEQRQ